MLIDRSTIINKFNSHLYSFTRTAATVRTPWMGRARIRMGSSRVFFMASALLLVGSAVAAAADAQQGCPDLTYSKFVGTKKSGAKYVDHTQLSSKGNIVQVSLYYNKVAGCLRGAKAAFGDKPTPGMIGSSANTTEAALKLKGGEYVTKVDYKATKCIEYVKVITNKGRSVSVGSASAPAALITTAANKTGGRLIAIRGFQSMAGSKPEALQQLQFVWGSGNCQPAETAELKYESGSIPNSDPTVCAAKTDMCDENASMNQFSYCVWNPPYTKSACRGGCCLSSGKCASSSCAISGVGKDVANMICYGTNAGVGFGGSELCTGLACKLATTGCTTDAFGGNCVGTVVHYAENVDVNPDSQKYIGATCLDATPSDYTLDQNGNEAGNEGIYMSKLWTICDCSTDGSDPYAGVPNVMNLTGMSNLTKNDVLLAISQVLPKVNLTGVVQSVTKGSDDDHRLAELFPSIGDIFKKPTVMPTITLPSFLGGGEHSAEGSTVNSSDTIQFKLPDLSTLLSSLAHKANSSEDVTTAAAAEPSLTPPITPASIASIPAKATLSAAKTAATALTGLRGFLGKIMPALTNSNMRTAGQVKTPASAAASAPVAVAAVPAAAAPAAAAATPAAQPVAAIDANKREGSSSTTSSSPAAAAVPAEAPKALTAPASAVATPAQTATPPAAAAAPPTTQTAAAPHPAEVAKPQQPAATPAAQPAAHPAAQQQQQQQPTASIAHDAAAPQAAGPAADAVSQPAAAAAPAHEQPSVVTVQSPPVAAAPVPEEPQQQQQPQPEQKKPEKPWYGGFSGLPSAVANYQPVYTYYEPYDEPAPGGTGAAGQAAGTAASHGSGPAAAGANPAAASKAPGAAAVAPAGQASSSGAH